MTTIYISKDQTTTVDATTNDDWVIETGVTVATSGMGIDATGEIAGRDFIILGALRSTNGPAMTLGNTALADSQSTIRIDYQARFESGGIGLQALSGGVHFEVVGDAAASGLVKTVGDSLDLRGGANHVKNDGAIHSTAGSAIVGTGSGNVIENNGTISARFDAFVISGGETIFTNNLTLSSTRGRGFVSAGNADILANNDRIITWRDAIMSSGSDVMITNTDTIRSDRGVGIHTTGDHATIESTTLIRGQTFGILSTGDDAYITNSGTVRSSGVGIQANGSDSVVNTSSQLIGRIALIIGGDHSQATNLNEIHGTSKTTAAVCITATDGASFTNNGAVFAKSDIGILGGIGDDSIDNTGSLHGDVRLGRGNDWFRSATGEVGGKVYGGKGDDVYEAGIELRIVEHAGQGNDTVKAAFTWTLSANIENLELSGSANADGIGNKLDNIISGNAGDNRLTGGAGHDIFAFASDGQDTIMDFKDGKDLIDLRAVDGIEGFADMSGHMRQIGRDVVIDLSALDDAPVFTIRKINLTDLTASDFLF
jgi:hypothetical protein